MIPAQPPARNRSSARLALTILLGVAGCGGPSSAVTTDAPLELEELCRGGHIQACHRLGRIYQDGAVASPDPSRAVSHLDRACRAGYALACHDLAWVYIRGVGLPRDVARGVVLLERGCDEDSPDACWSFGWATGMGLGVPRHGPRGEELKAQAWEMYTDDCEGGDAGACRRLARLVGPLASQPRRRAAAERAGVRGTELYEARCRDGDGEACHWLGVMYWGPHAGVQRSDRRAATWWSYGCEQGYRRACRNLETLTLVHDNRPAASCVRAAKALRRTCLGDLRQACLRARARYKRVGEQADTCIAAKLLQKGCSFGSAEACHALGTVFQHGDGHERALEGANVYYTRAAALGGKLSVEDQLRLVEFERLAWIPAHDDDEPITLLLPWPFNP